MNRKKCYCSNKFCKCLFGCGCTIFSNVTGKCMCCIMEENDKRLRRRGRVVPGTTEPIEVECKCNFDEPKFYDIIVYNKVGDDEYYWSCRYGCLVTITEGSFNPNNADWTNGAVENNKSYTSKVEITYATLNVETSEDDVNILIVKEQNLKHVWCQVNGQPDVSLN